MKFYCPHYVSEDGAPEEYLFPYHTVVLVCCEVCIGKFKVNTGGASGEHV